MDLWQYEKELYKDGIKFIGGVDEVGRGPLVGNVVAACCVLPKNFKLDGLTDSKKLSEKKREEYYEYIVNNCIAYGIGKCSPEEIDKYNILEATKKAMKKAIKEVKKKINLEYVLIDGNMKFDLYNYPSVNVWQGMFLDIAKTIISILDDNSSCNDIDFVNYFMELKNKYFNKLFIGCSIAPKDTERNILKKIKKK